MTSTETLAKIKQGNERFISGNLNKRTVKPADLAGGQSPHTIVLTCADSRVPPELLFDQDLGEVFVIRVAGNTATDEAIGSIEYAAANLGSSLIVVLGHTSCGAVAATVDHVKTGNGLPTQFLQKVVDPIVAPVNNAMKSGGDSEVLDTAIDLNVKTVVQEVSEKSPILKELIGQGKISVVGAKYELASGKVHFNN